MTLVDELAKREVEPALPFEPGEYQRRLAAVRQSMAERGLDLLIVSKTPNIGYLTGYDTQMPLGYSVLLVGATGEPTLHCSELEAPCMLLNGNVRDIEVFDWHAAADTGTDLARIVQERGYGSATIGIEMGFAENFASGALDAKSYVALTGLCPEATFVDTTTLILETRLIKSPAEIEYMRTAGSYTGIGLDAAMDAAGDGATDNDVMAAVYGAMVAAGCELMSTDPMVMAGERTGWMPHLAYRRVRMSQGDPVYVELTGTHFRYNAPGMRSASIGPPSADVRRLADASLATVDLLLGEIRPGRTGDDVARAAKVGLASVPDAFFHGAFGYSIGMGFQPAWTECPFYLSEGNERELEPRMAFHLAICLWIAGERGIGFSESVVVTDDGCELLTPGRGRELRIV